MSTPLPIAIDLGKPIGVPEGKDAKLPTSFRVNTEVKAHLESLQRGPRKRGFHPSELPKLCAMKFYLYEQALEGFASSDPNEVQESMRTVRAILDTVHEVAPGRLPSHLEPDFAAGDAIHLYQQFRYGERGYLWGRWKCPHCRAVSDNGFMPRIEVLDACNKPIKVAAPCPSCKGRNYLREHGQVRWKYVEPWTGLIEWELEGHCDGILLMPRKDFIVPAIFEVKSINEAGYYGRYGEPLPKEDHIKQASQYVFAARQTYPFLRELRHIYFVYVNKNAQRDTKEFLVSADMGVVDQMQQTMSTVLQAKQAGQAPEHARRCHGIDDVNAIKCPMVEKCYGRKPAANFFDPDSFPMEELPL